jgi:hypothetical protein
MTAEKQTGPLSAIEEQRRGLTVDTKTITADPGNRKRDAVYYPGMKPGATKADEDIVRWMWQQPPLCNIPLDKKTYTILAAKPFSELSSWEFNQLAAEVKRQNTGIKFRLNADGFCLVY